MDRRIFLKCAAAGAVVVTLPETLLSALSGLSGCEIEKKVKELVSQMTLDEKIEQMAGKVTIADSTRRALDPNYADAWYTPENKRLNIPRFIMIDGPRGMGMAGSSCFPVGMCRGAAFDAELERRVGEAAGYETRVRGANVLLAPCINVVWHSSWGRSQETYGEDPVQLGALGAAFVEGAQKHVMACAKHYAVNNIEDTRFEVNAVVDERTLREIFLPHFKKCVDAGVASVMSAYNDVNGKLAGQNPHLCRTILKEEWGFDGFVVSDWINAVDDGVAAVNAGLDIEMPNPSNVNKKNLKKAVADGRVKEEYIDDAVARLLRAKLRFIVDDMRKGYDMAKVAGPEHAALAREAARKGAVLLKNEKAALPLDRSQVKKIAVIGKLAGKANLGDYGSSAVRPPYAVTPLEGLKAKAGGVEIVYQRSASPAAVKKSAAGADAVIVVAGCGWNDEGEGFYGLVGGDRVDLGLHPEDVKMIKAAAEVSNRVIVVLEAGSAITMEDWVDGVEAILMAWYPGMEGGNALAEIIFGEASPSGKLPIVFPKDLGQMEKFDNQSKEVVYGKYHGYRWFDKKGIEPRFPFGFGLSYTTFEIANLKLSAQSIGKSGSLRVSVDVTNTGATAGEEVVQLYVAAKGSAVERAVKELKGFTRVALAPGETKTAALELAAQDLAYFCDKGMKWIVEEIEYEAMVGTSAADKDLALRRSFTIAGE